MSNPALVEVVRSGFVESMHHGALVVTEPDGSVRLAVGDVDRPVFPRSSNKPFQALGMLRAGLEVDDEDLAFAAGSHNGEPKHVERALALLERHGLAESDLVLPAGVPEARDEQARCRRRTHGRPQSGDELLRQARRDARHLCATRVADGGLPGP